MARFFHNGVRLREDAVLASICKVQQILHWFQSQQKLVFYASSLLFVYEGLPSSSSPAPLHSSLPVGPAVNESAALSLAADGGQEEKGVREETVEEKGVAENNNNTEVAVPRDCSPPTIYNQYMKARERCSGEGCLHGNSGDGTPEITSGSNSGLWEEDNATWQQRGVLKASANGNQTKPQLERKDEDRERGEEPGRGGGAEGEGGRDVTDVEVRMIDFAHVFQSDSCDQGYIYGLKNLLTALEQILCDAAQSSLSAPTS